MPEYLWSYGKVNEHNSSIPRDFRLENEEKQAIVEFYDKHSKDGYRRSAYIMIDKDIAAASPSSVYRVLKDAEIMRKSWNQYMTHL